MLAVLAGNWWILGSRILRHIQVLFCRRIFSPKKGVCWWGPIRFFLEFIIFDHSVWGSQLRSFWFSTGTSCVPIGTSEKNRGKTVLCWEDFQLGSPDLENIWRASPCVEKNTKTSQWSWKSSEILPWCFWSLWSLEDKFDLDSEWKLLQSCSQSTLVKGQVKPGILSNHICHCHLPQVKRFDSIVHVLELLSLVFKTTCLTLKEFSTKKISEASHVSLTVVPAGRFTLAIQYFSSWVALAIQDQTDQVDLGSPHWAETWKMFEIPEIVGALVTLLFQFPWEGSNPCHGSHQTPPPLAGA